MTGKGEPTVPKSRSKDSVKDRTLDQVDGYQTVLVPRYMAVPYPYQDIRRDNRTVNRPTVRWSGYPPTPSMPIEIIKYRRDSFVVVNWGDCLCIGDLRMG